jgi:hypothetical protein
MSGKSLLLLAGVLVVGAGTLFKLGISSTNCGGNTAALNQVGTITGILRGGASASEQRQHLELYSPTHWCRGARFLVRNSPLPEQEIRSRQIIVVCDKPYDNLPKQWVVFRKPMHAAGYSDGSTGLIPVAEFASLDRSAFTPLEAPPAPTE